jgi:glycosyltransferase involved in cell wall biosynthesis
MRISFVIPAFNEAKWIERCLQHIDNAVDACRETRSERFTIETIVVDNNSSDATSQLAENAGATVVYEPLNQISRARNAGAAAATADWLVFIDADSELSTGLLADVLELIDAGEHVGCGSLMSMHDIPRSMRWSLTLWTWLSGTLNWAAGSFVVCRADVFAQLGGFSEKLFVAEEIDFSRRIKKYARQQRSKFVVLRDHPLLTSNRKVRLYSQKELFRQSLRLLWRPRKALRDKSALDVWYDGRRE